MLAKYRAGNTFANPDVLDSELDKVVQLNPNFAPAYVVRSRIRVQQHQLQEALGMAKQAERLEPDRAGYVLNVAEILLLKGESAKAAQIAEYVARRWWGPDRAEALDLLTRAQGHGESKSEVLPVSLEYADGTTSVTGTIESVMCADPHDKAHETELVLRTTTGPVTFHSSKSFGVGFSDTIWYGEDHFTICHHLTGLNAVVRYKAVPKSQVSFEPAWLEIRDDVEGFEPPSSHAESSTTR